jgi:UDP-N-acetylglucosamine--N-acetylmuramyl-(pentapeptide) pyrophosphoryl-undecaprenol N-acetylglucosamine transferase
MKIVFTGAGSGGHFYPLIAVAEEIRRQVTARQLIDPQLFYIAPSAFDEAALFANNITFVACPAGKIRRYFSLDNMKDVFLTLSGIFKALLILFRISPDVIFSKGGYASVPTILAARILGIPVIIHESDAKPGRATLLASHSAFRIAVAFESVIQYFPKKAQLRTGVTGIPVRAELMHADVAGAEQLLGLDTSVPTVLILGGSLGSQRINDLILAGLPDLVSFCNVIHQTGKDNFKAVELSLPVLLEGVPHADRYHAFPYLGSEPLRQAASAARLIVSRAGSTSITEIALWKKPAILIPIPEQISHDQRANAYAYAHTGAATVLEEGNMTPHVLVSEIRRIATDPVLAQAMAEKGSTFGNPKAAELIANELIAVCLSHENSSAPAVAKV